ncbi:hypothetical protein PMZ80_003901 [Knufia obscura]|uniref:DUF8035 domain-containing protein n=1 Tax=Knufia obscura TaxID=1635080 RepID=A0ABR0RWF8_9EURO|nr:hypothetical protein PMZ80_003901 [Knufia obscura]
MSGIEIIGLAASVVQIAEVGGKLSVKLFTFTRKVKNANKSIDALSQDIAATGAVLKQLGETLSKDASLKVCSQEALDTAKTLVEDTKKVFDGLEKLIDGDEKSSNKFLKGISWKQRLKFPFLEPQIAQVQANLERLKSSLLVILNVLIFAEQLRNQEALPILKDQRELIKVLATEKDENEKRYERILKAIEDKPTHQTSASADNAAPSIKSVDLGLTTISTATTIVPDNASLSSINLASLPESKNDSTLPKIDLPPGLKHHHQRIQHHSDLVQNLLLEIKDLQYDLDHGTRARMHSGVLDIHWNEWAAHRQRHGHEHFQKIFEKHADVARYWTDQVYLQEVPISEVEEKFHPMAPKEEKERMARRKRVVTDDDSDDELFTVDIEPEAEVREKMNQCHTLTIHTDLTPGSEQKTGAPMTLDLNKGALTWEANSRDMSVDTDTDNGPIPHGFTGDGAPLRKVAHTSRSSEIQSVEVGFDKQQATTSSFDPVGPARRPVPPSILGSAVSDDIRKRMHEFKLSRQGTSQQQPQTAGKDVSSSRPIRVPGPGLVLPPSGGLAIKRSGKGMKLPSLGQDPPPAEHAGVLTFSAKAAPSEHDTEQPGREYETRLDKAKVSPEALRKCWQNFTIEGDQVIVPGVLSKDEIRMLEETTRSDKLSHDTAPEDDAVLSGSETKEAVQTEPPQPDICESKDTEKADEIAARFPAQTDREQMRRKPLATQRLSSTFGRKQDTASPSPTDRKDDLVDLSLLKSTPRYWRTRSSSGLPTGLAANDERYDMHASTNIKHDGLLKDLDIARGTPSDTGEDHGAKTIGTLPALLPDERSTHFGDGSRRDYTMLYSTSREDIDEEATAGLATVPTAGKQEVTEDGKTQSSHMTGNKYVAMNNHGGFVLAGGSYSLSGDYISEEFDHKSRGRLMKTGYSSISSKQPISQSSLGRAAQVPTSSPMLAESRLGEGSDEGDSYSRLEEASRVGSSLGSETERKQQLMQKREQLSELRTKREGREKGWPHVAS